MEKIKDQLRKILKLAESGIMGEQLAAQNLLAELLLKHNLKLEDIKEDAELEVVIYLDNDAQYQILNQLLSTFFGEKSKEYQSRKGFYMAGCRQKCRFVFYTNKVGKIDFLNYAQFYLDDWKKTYKKQLKQLREDLISAYISANNLYPEDVEPYGGSPVDYEKLRRISSLAKNIPRSYYHKSLKR